MAVSPGAGASRRWIAIPVVSVLAVVGLPIVAGVPSAQAADYRSTIMADNPISYWRLGQASTSSIVVDEKGVAGGVLNDSPTGGRPGAVVGDTNTATYFQGQAWAYLGAPPELRTQSLTVEAWFNSPIGSGGDRPIYKNSNPGVELALIDGKPTATIPYAIYAAEWQLTTITASTSFADGLWHHVALTHDDSTMRLYVDGGLVAYSAAPSGVLYPYAVNDLTLAYDRGTGGKFLGDLDEIAFYDRPLTQAQLQAHYTAAGYTLKPVGGAITAAENPCDCTPGSPNVGSTQASVGAPVNTATGNMWHTFPGISVPGRGLALNFKPTFNSQSSLTTGPLGFGWTHSYASTLTVGPTGVVTVRQENSAELTFTPAGSGYSAPPRITASLVHNPDGSFTLTRRAGETLSFDSAGRLVAEKDANGYVTALTYNGAGQLATVTDPAQRTLTLVYVAGRVTSVTDTAGPPRVLGFAYDGAGNMTDMTDIGGGVWHFTYDAAHRMLTMLDPAQAGSPTPVALTNHYDGSGRVDWQKDFLARQTTFDYTSVPGSTKVTDPKGNVVVYRYEYGLLKAVTRAPGTSQQAVWTYEYEPATVGLASVTDPNDHTTTMTYDGRGNRLTTTDPLNRTTTSTYGPFDRITSATDAKNIATTFTYDATGNLKTTSTPLAPGTGSQVVTLNYDPSRAGDVLSMVDADGKAWSYTYNANGDLITTKDPVTPTAGTSAYCYDGVGRQVATISPKGTALGVTCATSAPAAFTTYTTYSKFGDVLTVTDPLAHQTVRTYDPDRRLKTAKDADNNVTTYNYDTAGQLTDTARPDGTHLRQDYWLDGSLNHTFDGANQPTTYTYDPLGRLSTSTDPDARTTMYAYDLAGNRTSVQQPGGNCSATPKTACVTYAYDAGNQVSSVTYSDTPSANISAVGYDADGQRTSMTDATGSSSWAWDSLHRLTASTTGGATTGYAYDLKGQLTQLTYPGTTGRVTRAYDEAGRLRSVTDWAARQSQFTYDADGFMTSGAGPAANGVTTTYTPDGADRLMGITDTKGATTLASFTYGRDAAGQVSSVASTGVPADNHSYSYTQLNQLKNVDATAYAYSPADNLTGMVSGTTLGYDAANQATSVVKGTGTSTVGFDSRGNRTSVAPAGAPTTTLAYDQANRLTSVDASAFPNAISAGWYHSLAVKSDGTVWAWGLNSYGQLGDNSTTDATVPVPVGGLSGVVAVAAGAYQSTALRSDGTVWAWGANSVGQLGNNSTTDSHVPVQVQGLAGVVAISAGVSHTLALKADGTVWAWGYNAYGQLGNNSVVDAHVPVQVQGLSGVSAIAGGYVHSAALRSDGTVWAWGYNAYGQLGNNSVVDAHVPVQVQGLTGVSAIASGWFHMLALRSDGTPWAWGFNSNGQLGNNSTVEAHLPLQIPGISGVASISATTYQSFAQKTDATLWSWGQNPYGQLGNGTIAEAHVPTATGQSGLKGVSPGPNHTLAQRADGTLVAWGWNGLGNLGNGTTIDARTPVAVLTSAPKSYSATVAGGWFHSLSVKNDGTVWAWGYNAYGQLGNNSTTDSSVPVQVPGLSGVVAVAAGAYNSVALRSDGTVWAWGYNGYGQLGNNSTTESHVPVQVSGLSGVTAIAAGTSHVLAVRSDGTAWAWGYNSNGQLGNNAVTDALVPVQVSGLSGVTGVSGGYSHSVAVRSDGTVWAWGYNGYGQLGNNSTTDSHVPVQASGLTGASTVSAGFFHTLALKADGTVWAWGYNAYGELGNNSTTDSHVPLAVPGLSAVAAIAAGSYHSYVLGHDGTVWDFGLNNYGQLGNNSTTDAHVPIAVGVANATGLAAGYIHVLVPRADNTLTAWGYNAFGAVGNGNLVDAHAPVSVTGFNRGGTFYNRGTSPKATYAYNGDGLRTAKTVAGVTRAMAWNVAEGVPSLLSDGTNTYVYGPGGLPLEQIDASGNVLYFHHDQGGSTRMLSNASGAVVSTFTYDAYARMTASTGSVTTPLGYAGEYTDAETGFTYLRARYYDPTTGQFISRDPLVALTGSAYGYVEGNPLNGTDPLGLFSLRKFIQDHGAQVAGAALFVGAVACVATVACATALATAGAVVTSAIAGATVAQVGAVAALVPLGTGVVFSFIGAINTVRQAASGGRADPCSPSLSDRITRAGIQMLGDPASESPRDLPVVSGGIQELPIRPAPVRF